MPDYKRMYAMLCGAIDDVTEPLETVAEAAECVCVLKEALLKAEEVYIVSSGDGDTAN